jgi:hypothetical protein
MRVLALWKVMADVLSRYLVDKLPPLSTCIYIRHHEGMSDSEPQTVMSCGQVESKLCMEI